MMKKKCFIETMDRLFKKANYNEMSNDIEMSKAAIKVAASVANNLHYSFAEKLFSEINNTNNILNGIGARDMLNHIYSNMDGGKAAIRNIAKRDLGMVDTSGLQTKIERVGIIREVLGLNILADKDTMIETLSELMKTI